jgi:hypothetical protein
VGIKKIIIDFFAGLEEELTPEPLLKNWRNNGEKVGDKTSHKNPKEDYE